MRKGDRGGEQVTGKGERLSGKTSTSDSCSSSKTTLIVPTVL